MGGEGVRTTYLHTMFELIKEVFRYWRGRLRGILFRKMATQKNTIATILEVLNGEGNTGPWVEVTGFYMTNQGSIQIKDTVTTITKKDEALAVKYFVHTETGEIKTYIAKWLDDPEASQLP